MQTQYKLLYRYINENTQTPITGESNYDKTEKFIGPDGKLNIQMSNIGSTVEPVVPITQEQLDLIHQDASQENENLMIENMANEDKANNLFVYTGTTKTYTSKFVPAQYGYLVRDYTMIPKAQIPESSKDFTKHFIFLHGDKAGFGDTQVICKPQYMKTYFSTVKYTATDDRTYISNFTNTTNARTMFTWLDANNIGKAEYQETALTITPVDDYTVITDDNGNNYVAFTKQEGQPVERYERIVGVKAVTVGVPKRILYSEQTIPPIENSIVPFTKTYTYGGYSCTLNFTGVPEQQWNNYLQTYKISVCSQITIAQTNLLKTIIPEHEEPMGTPPYYIKDNYKKIEMSPWMIHSIHNSLESALQSARKIVSMIGMENVKLIKYVPIDQFVKLK